TTSARWDRARPACSRCPRRRPRCGGDRRAAGKGATMPTKGFRGAIFDVDGVLVDSPHEQAWRESLRELMEGEWADIRPRTRWSPQAFTSEVYQRVMSGKPRMSGALAGLEYFQVPDADKRVETYAARKQQMVIRLIEEGRFTAYPDALRFVLAVRGAGLSLAAASSSKNAGLFL